MHTKKRGSTGPRRSVIGRAAAAFFTLFLVALLGNFAPHDAAAQQGPAPSPWLGVSRAVVWVTLAGVPSPDPSNTSINNEPVYNDSVATWRAHLSAGVDPHLVTLVYPFTRVPHPEPPEDAKASTLHAHALDLPDLFHPKGQITRRLQANIGDRPDLVVVHLAAYGAESGGFQWGTETISLDTLEAMLTNLHAAYRVPVVLIADRCHPSATRGILERLNGETWRESTYVITASLPRQSAHAQRFAEAWQHRGALWPKAGAALDQIRSTFDDGTVYGRLATNVVAGWLGAAADVGSDGIDAADLCAFLQQTELARQQPPVSASPDTKADIRCDEGALRSRFQEWSARFAFTVPAVTIDLDTTEPPFYSMNKDVPFSEVSGAFKATLESRAAAAGYPRSGFSITLCKGRDCGHDWSCFVDWEQGAGYRAQCEQRQRRRIVATGSTTPSIDDLKRRLARIAERLFPPPRAAPSAKTVDAPRVSTLDTSVTYAVLLDRSKSMTWNDPENRKRRLFFDSVIHPAIVNNRVERLLMVSFASDVRSTVCYERGGDVDQARRCYLREATADGRTHLLSAVNKLVNTLGPNDVVWLVSDGADSEWIEDCVDAHVGVRNLGQCETDFCTTPTSRYLECEGKRMAAAGERLAADHRRIFAVFLGGTANNASALRQLTQIRGSANTEQFLLLANGEDERVQERKLLDLGQTAIGKSLATLPRPQHACTPQAGSVRCTDTIEIDVGPNSSELQIQWKGLVVENQSVNLPSAEISLGPRNPTAVDSNGVSIRLAVSDGVTSVSWSPRPGRKLPTAKWTVELNYRVTGVDR